MLNRPNVTEVKQLLEEKKEHAWLELALRYGKCFWYQGVLVTCDPTLSKLLLNDKIGHSAA